MLYQLMQQLLYDMTVAARQVQSVHWNLVAREFISIHMYLGEVYEDYAEYVDVIAEQIKYLGESPIASLTMAQQFSTINLRDADRYDTINGVMIVLEATKIVKDRAEAVCMEATKEDNNAVNEVFSGISSELDKVIYFLSHTEGQEVSKSITVESLLKNCKDKYNSINKVTKFNDSEQLVFGWASVAKNADGSLPLDWQGDIIDPLDLEKAVYNYVLKFRVSNDMHTPNSDNGNLVESIMFTKEKMKTLGIPEGILPEGWFVGFKINDPIAYAKVKSGEYKMFSIEGSARRKEV